MICKGGLTGKFGKRFEIPRYFRSAVLLTDKNTMADPVIARIGAPEYALKINHPVTDQSIVILWDGTIEINEHNLSVGPQKPPNPVNTIKRIR